MSSQVYMHTWVTDLHLIQSCWLRCNIVQARRHGYEIALNSNTILLSCPPEIDLASPFAEREYNPNMPDSLYGNPKFSSNFPIYMQMNVPINIQVCLIVTFTGSFDTSFDLLFPSNQPCVSNSVNSTNIKFNVWYFASDIVTVSYINSCNKLGLFITSHPYLEMAAIAELVC